MAPWALPCLAPLSPNQGILRPCDGGHQDRGLGGPCSCGWQLKLGAGPGWGVPPAEEQCRLGKKKDGGGWACSESLYLTSIFPLSRTPLKSLSGS